MKKGSMGFVGGLIGGLFYEAVDRIGTAGGISRLDSAATAARLLHTTSIWGFVLIVLVGGITGWLVALLISEKYLRPYWFSGLWLGAALWVLMNLAIIASGITIPTWSMGAGTLVVNLIAHMVWAAAITYALTAFSLRKTA